MRKMLFKWLLNAVAFYLAAVLFPPVRAETPATILLAAVVLGLVNIFIKPLLLLLTIPVNLLTLGLFTLVINTLMVMLTGTLVPTLHIPGFGAAFAIALMISALNLLFGGFIKKR